MSNDVRTILCGPYRTEQTAIPSSVVLSAPIVLRPQVQIPSTRSTLFAICIIEIVIGLRKGRKETKEAGIGPYFKEPLQVVHFTLKPNSW